tara:strand:- start:1232 stop:1420 length:189 start_codon:yes stop_codon:yes gene_type:complete
MDYVGLTALIIAVLSALGHFIETAHIKKIKIGCMESDCSKTPAPTPATSTTTLNPTITATGC